MVRPWLLALLFMALVGCVRQGQSPVDLPSPAPLSQQQWQRLEEKICQIPDELSLAIRQEARLRLRNTPQPQDTAVDLPVLEDVLTNLLLHSRNPLLHADDDFTKRLNLLDNTSPLPQAAFAQALSGFLLTPDFDCHHPIFADYFQRRYQRPCQPCQEMVPFMVVSRDEGVKTMWLDPQRVRAIHLVFAGHGEALASRFGHVSLRLIVCPADDSTVRECNINLYGHLVLGYMAHIDEFELNTIKALSGQYKAHLFAFPFMDAYRGYAIDEFREIYSVPLTLDAARRQLLLRELAEIHWCYAGDYNFFRRNCATLLQQSLRVLLPDYAANTTLTSDYLRPDNFFAAISQTPLVEAKRLTELKTAEENGYYFPSTKSFYEQALRLVRDNMNQPHFTDIDSYLARPPAIRLTAILADQAYLEKLSLDPHLLEAQQLLEELFMLRGERRVLARSSRYFHNYGNQLQDPAALARLTGDDRHFLQKCFLRPLRQVTAPIPKSSAIPQPDGSLPQATQRPATCRKKTAPARLSAILGEVVPEGTARWQEILTMTHLLEKTINNILVLQELRYEPNTDH